MIFFLFLYFRTSLFETREEPKKYKFFIEQRKKLDNQKRKKLQKLLTQTGPEFEQRLNVRLSFG